MDSIEKVFHRIEVRSLILINEEFLKATHNLGKAENNSRKGSVGS